MSSAFRLSIGANVVLLGLVAVLLWRERSGAPAPAAPSSPAATPAGTARTHAPAKEAPTKSAGVRLNPDAVAQFEQAGISRELLVAAWLAGFQREETRQMAALQKKYAPRPVPDHALHELARANERDRVRGLKEAFGEEGYRAWDKEQTLRELNRARPPGDELTMTAEESEQAYRLQKEFDQKARDLQLAMEDGAADPADAGTLQAQAQAVLDRELGKLLGPQRFNELRGNVDSTVDVYRTFSDLNPTADQAKAVVQANADYRARQQALTTRVNENPAEAAAITAELKAMDEAREESLRRIFGPEAYENSKRQNDPTYRTLQQYAEAWALKDEEIQPVYETLHALQSQVDRTRAVAELNEAAGQRVNWRTVDATIEQARQQAEAGLEKLIGGERARRLKQNGVLTMR